VELGAFRDEPTLEAAVRRAGLTLLADGRRDPHHTRRPQELLDRAAARLAERVPAFATAASFGQILDIVDKAVGHFTGLGSLYVYDTALRIGAKRDLLPTRIYLHAGTREGAKKLVDVTGRRVLDRSELIAVAPAIVDLAPHEIEDVLCIYKDRLEGDPGDLDELQRCWPDEPDRGVC
jgi:hypothetical protein